MRRSGASLKDGDPWPSSLSAPARMNTRALSTGRRWSQRNDNAPTTHDGLGCNRSDHHAHAHCWSTPFTKRAALSAVSSVSTLSSAESVIPGACSSAFGSEATVASNLRGIGLTDPAPNSCVRLVLPGRCEVLRMADRRPPLGHTCDRDAGGLGQQTPANGMHAPRRPSQRSVHRPTGQVDSARASVKAL